MVGGNFLSCTHLVPQLSSTMGNHTETDDFFLVDLDDMKVILGIQFQKDGVLLSSGWQKGSSKGNVEWEPKGNLAMVDGGNLLT